MKPRTFPKEKVVRPRRSRLDRVVHIDGKEWQWGFGGVEGIIIRSPDGQTYPASWKEVTGMSDDWDWWCDRDARAITPGRIKEYILRSIK